MWRENSHMELSAGGRLVPASYNFFNKDVLFQAFPRNGLNLQPGQFHVHRSFPTHLAVLRYRTLHSKEQQMRRKGAIPLHSQFSYNRVKSHLSSGVRLLRIDIHRAPSAESLVRE